MSIDRYKQIVQLCGMVIITISGLALTGWFIKSTTLQSFKMGYIPMAPNTALAFTALGLSLWIGNSLRQRSVLFVRICALFSLSLSTIRLTEFILGIDLGVDNLFFHFPINKTGLFPIGKMAFYSALDLLISSITLLLLSINPRPRIIDDIARGMAIISTFIGLVFTLGYLYDAPLLYGNNKIPMAFNTGISLIILGSGLLIMSSIREISVRRKLKENLRVSLEERTLDLKNTKEKLEQDIIESKSLEDSLRKSEQHIRAILEAIPDIAMVIDEDGRYIDVLSEDKSQLYPAKVERKFRLMHEVLPKEHADLYLEVIQKTIKTGKTQVIEFSFEGESGVRWFEARTACLKGESDKQMVVVVARDITRRKANEELLIEYQKDMRRLTSQLSLTEERERKSIASKLHDEIGHTLVIANMELTKMRDSLSLPEVKEQADKIRVMIAQLIKVSRSLTYDLSPPVLYELGLVSALEWVAEEFQKRHDISIVVENETKSIFIENDIRFLLFQAVRELLVNIIKHSKANQAKIMISLEGEYIRIIVRDNGVGFDPSQINLFKSKNKGYGLFNIRERMTNLGGYLEISSHLNQGTTIILKAPIKVEK